MQGYYGTNLHFVSDISMTSRYSVCFFLLNVLKYNNINQHHKGVVDSL